MGAQIANLRRIMRAHNDGATPIYVTELGWGPKRPDPLGARPLGSGAAALAVLRAALRSTAFDWRIGGVWWFTWTDEGGSCQSSAARPAC